VPAAREDDDVPDRRDVVRDSLGVGLATGLYGASFGALGVASGLSVLQTWAMSVLIFTGASQFAFVGVLASGGARCRVPSPPCCSAAATPCTGCGWHRSWPCRGGGGWRPRTWSSTSRRRWR